MKEHIHVMDSYTAFKKGIYRHRVSDIEQNLRDMLLSKSTQFIKWHVWYDAIFI